MSWFVLAIIGHLSNGVAFVIDKALLSSAFKRSATYAGLVGILSFVVIVASPWVTQWPQGSMLLLALLSGMTFVLALWGFFAALSRAEASRVVPIVGSLIPVLTLIGTYTFLGERLSSRQLLGFFFLVLATAILSSSGGHTRPSRSSVGFSILSAALFAIASVTAKLVYDSSGFLPGFLTTRLAAAVTALLIVCVIDRVAGAELWSMIRPKTRHESKKRKEAAWLAVLGQSLGAAGFLFVQIGTAQGSASIVNALQAVQYAFLVLAAFALRKRTPKLLGENLDKKVVIVKLIALAVTALGLALVV